jgi:hypothetical protein
MLLNVVAVVYGAVMLVNLAWPRAEFYGTAWYQQYAVVIFVPCMALAGWFYYRVAQRGGSLKAEDGVAPAAAAAAAPAVAPAPAPAPQQAG